MRVMADPVTLPVKPINKENLGTSRASRNDVVSKAPRTSRAEQDTPPLLCLEYRRAAGSGRRNEEKEVQGG